MTLIAHYDKCNISSKWCQSFPIIKQLTLLSTGVGRSCRLQYSTSEAKSYQSIFKFWQPFLMYKISTVCSSHHASKEIILLYSLMLAAYSILIECWCASSTSPTFRLSALSKQHFNLSSFDAPLQMFYTPSLNWHGHDRGVGFNESRTLTKPLYLIEATYGTYYGVVCRWVGSDKHQK